MRNSDIREQNLNNIHEAAFELFIKNGIESTTVNEIAKKAGISKVALYKHFESKTDIALMIVNRAVDVFHINVQHLFETDEYKRLSGIEQLERVLNTYQSIERNDPNFYLFFNEFRIYTIRHNLPEEKTRSFMDFVSSSVRKYYSAAVEKGRRDGSITMAYPEQDAYDVINSAFRGIFLMFFLDHPVLEEHLIAELKRKIHGVIRIVLRAHSGGGETE